jgi:hypothetical protein
MSYWANSFPEEQGLYNPELEKDACGVGFMVNIKGIASHQILSDAKHVLCNMTHRGKFLFLVDDDDCHVTVVVIEFCLF